MNNILLGNWWTCVRLGSRKSTAQNGGVLDFWKIVKIMLPPTDQSRTATNVSNSMTSLARKIEQKICNKEERKRYTHPAS